MKNSLLFIEKYSTFFIIIGIILFALAPRIWHLSSAPPTIVDEPANIRDILILINKGGFHPAYFEWGFGQGTLVHYPAIITHTIFGLHDWQYAIRLSAVLWSIAALIPFFFLMKKYTNLFTATVVTILFSSSYYYLQFSRVGWTNIYAVTVGLFLLCCIEYLPNKHFMLSSCIAGILAGIVLYTYRGSEIYLLVAIPLLLIHILKLKVTIYKKVVSFILFFCIALLVSFPWLIQITTHWEQYNLRSRVVSVNNLNPQSPYHGLKKKSDIWMYQINTSIQGWILLRGIRGGGAEDSRYLPEKIPLVNFFIQLCFWAGSILAIIGWRRFWPWISIYIFGIIFGQILTVDPPNGSRGLIMLPVLYFFSGLAIFKLQQFKKYQWIIQVCIILATIIFSLLDIRYYQYWMTWIRV